MKKILNYRFVFALALMGVFASCSDDEDVTLDTRSVKPLVSVDQSTFSLTEGESFTVTLTSNKALSTSMDFKLELVGGNGSFRDFEVENGDESTPDEGAGAIGYIITMPAYATTYSFTVSPLIDLDVEGTETFVFALTSAVNARGLVAEGSGTITATVADFISDNVGVELTWDGNSTNYFGNIVEGKYSSLNGSGDVVKTPFTAYDYDLYIVNAGTFDVNQDGATGDSPEMSMVSAEDPDGDYWLIADLYSAGPAPITPFVFNLYMKVSKYGHWSVTIPIPGYGSNHAVSAPAGLDLDLGATIVATLTKTGTNYVLKNEEGDVLAQGRLASLSQNFKSKKVRK